MRKDQLMGMCILVLCFFFFAWAGASLAAEKYPSKPIQIVVGFKPGSTDLNLRPIVEKMPDYLGQPLSFTFKPGAGGAVGAKTVIAAQPDGYTLLGTTQSATVILPLTMEAAGYTLENFAPINCFVESAILLIVQGKAPWKTIKDLVEDAKKRPGMINYTSAGTFAITHLLGEAFSKESGIKLNHIPSQGGGPAVTALLGGHVDMASQTLTACLPHIRAGTLRALAVYNKKRIKALPDVPSLTELGYKLSSSISYGILAPKGTPKEVIETLNRAAQKAWENNRESIGSRYEKFGAEPILLGPEDYAAKLRGEHELFVKIVKEVKK